MPPKKQQKTKAPKQLYSLIQRFFSLAKYDGEKIFELLTDEGLGGAADLMPHHKDSQKAYKKYISPVLETIKQAGKNVSKLYVNTLVDAIVSATTVQYKNEKYAGEIVFEKLEEHAWLLEDAYDELKFRQKERAGKFSGKESPDDVLGTFAFPNVRIANDRPYERNTKVEDRIEDELNSHFSGRSSISSKSVSVLKDLLSQGKYSDIIKTPKVDVVYRGMAVSKKWIQKIVKNAKVLDGKKGSISANFTYVPKRGASSSWSKLLKKARDFAQDNIEDYTNLVYVVVLWAETGGKNANSFLSGDDGLYKLDFAKRFDHEREIVGLEDIKVFKITWERTSSED